MNIRFMQSGGGMLPFTYYQPVMVNSASPERIPAETTVKKSSDKKEKEDNDFSKLAKLVNTLKGLPSDLDLISQDINNLLRYAKMGVNPADLDAMYVKVGINIKKAQFSQQKYDTAEKNAESRGALTEMAVTSNGGVVVYDPSTKNPVPKTVSVSTYLKNKDKYTPVTNQELLELRAKYKGREDKLIDIVNSGTSFIDIDKQITEYIEQLGHNAYETSGTVKTQQQKLVEGVEFINNALAKAQSMGQQLDTSGLVIDGLYKAKLITKDQYIQARYNLQYIQHMLPDNMKTFLLAKAGSSENVLKILESAVYRKIDTEFKFTPELDDSADGSGKSSGSKKNSGGDVDLSAVQQLVSGYGYTEPLVLNIGNSYNITTKATHNTLVSKGGDPLKTGDSLKDITGSQQSSVLYFDHATFGGSKLNDLNLGWTAIKNNNMMIVELPYTVSKSGAIQPNLELTQKLENVDTIAAQRGIAENNYEAINKICQEQSIPPKYVQQNGQWVPNTYDYKRFAIIYANIDKRALAEPELFNPNLVETITDEDQLDAFTQLIRKNTNDKNYDIESGIWESDAIYRGYVFIPVKNDVIQATQTVPSSSQYKTEGDNAEAIRIQQAQFQEALRLKKLYNQAPSLSTLQ